MNLNECLTIELDEIAGVIGQMKQRLEADPDGAVPPRARLLPRLEKIEDQLSRLLGGLPNPER